MRAVGLYQPAWAEAGRRVPGPDEDAITMAAAAGRAALSVSPGAAVARVVVIARDPGYLDGAPLPVLTAALCADPAAAAATPAELRIGAAPAVIDAVSTAAPGTLVIAVETGPDGGAAAVLIGAPETGPPGTGGARLDDLAVAGHSLPMRVRATGAAQPSAYADPRAERELGWRPAIAVLAAGTEKPVLTGIPAADARRLGGQDPGELAAGAAAPLFALARMAEQGQDGRLIGLDAGLGAAVSVSKASELRVAADARPPLPASGRPRVSGAGTVIPMSMPSYERAVDAKLGLVGARCTVCGTESYPRRTVCLGCGTHDSTGPFALPRRGEVYSVVTVHVPVPGVPTPRGLAVVALTPTTVRVLAHVTDTVPDGCAIGDTGDLVLRLAAVRQGVPDYGYAFRPDLTAAGEPAPTGNGATS